MLWKFLKAFLGSGLNRVSAEETRAKIDVLFVQAAELFNSGRLEAAIETYREVLELDPYHVIAINQVALCLGKLKRDGDAGVYLERAALIDDTFAPGLVNFAIYLKDSFQTLEAERYLKRAREVVPDNPFIDSVLGAILMLRGEAREAISCQLSAWLKNFDERSFSANYLFDCCYSSEISADSVTAEHVFWAETLDEANLYPPSVLSIPANAEVESSRKRIRIGYISSDFREHSVCFFFRPLIENHDHNRFEIFAYHDIAFEDEQTDIIRKRCDVFRDIANLPDAEVIELLRNDRLDILVELTGHTSFTRIQLMGNRLARIQMTGLGYPPTTGLRGMDYKIVDSVTVPIGSEYLYAEKPLRLPGSFWCFNPLHDTPLPSLPPFLKRDYITFGCFGNLSKISRPVLDSWVEIMAKLPDSRLVIKALAFQDREAKESIQKWLGAAGIDIERVRFDLPDTPRTLFSAYADVDIVLDTWPFNGGTTSCFALWMGVPVVTMTGDSLVSRMGASMMHTLGLDELVAANQYEYVNAAVKLANDSSRLSEIRSNLRDKMLSTTLGNGLLYAEQFENACVTVLAEADANSNSDLNDRARTLPVISLQEVIRRAEIILNTDQVDAARRIINYALSHYPKSAGVRIQKSELYEREGKLEEACEFLTESMALVSEGEERRALRINLTRLHLLLGRYDSVKLFSDELLNDCLDRLGKLHIELYREAAYAWSESEQKMDYPSAELPFVSVIVHCEDNVRFLALHNNLSRVLSNNRYEIIRTQGESRIAEYENALKSTKYDIVLFVHPEVEILSPDFHHEMAEAIGRFDVIGFAGATRLGGPRWFDAGFEYVCGAVVQPADSQSATFNLSVYGPSRNRFSGGLSVLDGALLAVRKQVLDEVSFDLRLDGEHALCEIDWCNRASIAGFHLAAVPLLGVQRRGALEKKGKNWVDCVAYFREKHGLSDTPNLMPVAGASLLLKSPNMALPVLKKFYAVPLC